MSNGAAPRRRDLSRPLLILAIILLSAALAFLAWLFLELQPVPPSELTDEELQGMEWVRSIYGFGDSADEQLLTPTSVAVGRQGQIYVTDSTHGRILRATLGVPGLPLHRAARH